MINTLDIDLDTELLFQLIKSSVIMLFTLFYDCLPL